MSKTVSKILAICAMVVVIPLMIVGTAFVTIFGADKTVDVSVVVDEAAANYLDDAGNEVVVAAPQFEYEEELYSSHKVSAGKGQTVELSAQASDAYTFQGWFAGSVTEYQDALQKGTVEYVSDTLVFNLDMQDAADEYLAVYNVVRFNVAWSYKANPAAMQDVTATPEGGATQYKYGAELPKLTYTGADYSYKGWKVKDASGTEGSGKRYFYAIFDEPTVSDLVLTEPWLEAAKVTLSYYDETGAFKRSEDVRLNDEISLPNAAANAKNVQEGYRYFWSSNRQGTDEITTLTLTEQENASVYLQKEAIVYTATVNAGDATYKSDISQGVKFSVEDKNAIANLFNASNWTPNNSFWEFDGLSWSGTKYTNAATFADVFIHAHPQTADTATLNVAILKNYTKFNSTIGYEVWLTEFTATQVKENSNVVSGTRTNANIDEKLGVMFGYNQIEQGTWYAYSNTDSHNHKIALKAIEVKINGITMRMDITSSTPFASIKDQTFEKLVQFLLSTTDGENTAHVYKAIRDSAAQIDVLQIEKITGIYELLPDTI